MLQFPDSLQLDFIQAMYVQIPQVDSSFKANISYTKGNIHKIEIKRFFNFFSTEFFIFQACQ